MKTLTFVTGNKDKFTLANHVFKNAGIKLLQVAFDIDEIQSEDAEKIARDKAQKAYELVGKPIIITDDSWEIPGLKGFPGPYMKSINHWFTAEDFLHLTQSLTDRQVFLTQLAVYQDKNGQKVFQNKIPGKILSEVADFPAQASEKIISLTNDDTSIAEIFVTDPERHSRELKTVWSDVVAWAKQ